MAGPTGKGAKLQWGEVYRGRVGAEECHLPILRVYTEGKENDRGTDLVRTRL